MTEYTSHTSFKQNTAKAFAGDARARVIARKVGYFEQFMMTRS